MQLIKKKLGVLQIQSSQYTVVYIHDFSFHGMTKIQNLITEYYFWHMEFNLHIYFLLDAHDGNKRRRWRIFTKTVIQAPYFDVDWKFFITFKDNWSASGREYFKGKKLNPRNYISGIFWHWLLPCRLVSFSPIHLFNLKMFPYFKLKH